MTKLTIRHETIMKMLDALESKPMSLAELSEHLHITKAGLRKQLYRLEEQGVVHSTTRETPYRGYASHERVIVLDDRSKYIPKLRKTYEWKSKRVPYRKSSEIENKPIDLPFDPVLSRMMGYTDIVPPKVNPVRMLDNQVRPEPLRKLNLAWHGYSCETSV
jgi:biotin operon repressor